jgi:hypothetical protein
LRFTAFFHERLYIGPVDGDQVAGDICFNSVGINGFLDCAQLSGEIEGPFVTRIDGNLLQGTINTINRLSDLGFRTIVFSSDTFENVLFINNSMKIGFTSRFWLGVHALFQHNPAKIK